MSRKVSETLEKLTVLADGNIDLVNEAIRKNARLELVYYRCGFLWLEKRSRLERTPVKLEEVVAYIQRHNTRPA